MLLAPRASASGDVVSSVRQGLAEVFDSVGQSRWVIGSREVHQRSMRAGPMEEVDVAAHRRFHARHRKPQSDSLQGILEVQLASRASTLRLLQTASLQLRFPAELARPVLPNRILDFKATELKTTPENCLHRHPQVSDRL
eukprot:1753122-Rhodomonas_salina.3